MVNRENDVHCMRVVPTPIAPNFGSINDAFVWRGTRPVKRSPLDGLDRPSQYAPLELKRALKMIIIVRPDPVPPDTKWEI